MKKVTQIIAIVYLLLSTLYSNAQVFQYRGVLQGSPIPNTYYKDVVTGDVNNDGLLDLYLPQLQPGAVAAATIDHIYLNNGIGFTGGLNNLSNDFTFIPTNTAFPMPFQTRRGYDGELVDLDGDGNLDVLRPSEMDAPNIYVAWGNGAGTFFPVQVVNTIDPNTSCAARWYDDVDFADLDGDGDIDFIAAQYQSCGNNLIFRNDGGRNFTLIGNQLPATNTHSVSIGDFNQDGFQDVLLANGTNIMKIYKGTATPFVFNSTPLDLTITQGGVTPVADFFDLNQDGFLDVYIGKGNGQGVFFHSGNNNNPYPSFTLFTDQINPIYDARYADLNNDGNMEIIAVSCCGSPINAIQVFSIDGSNTITNTTANFFNSGDFHGDLGVELADLDNDGDLDLIIAGAEANGSAVHIYENTTTFDLYMQDVPNEFGVEPDIIAPYAWISEDIWVRNQQDGFTMQVHEDAEFSTSQSVYVYVRIRNKSFTTSLGTEQLRLYWAKAATALAWPNNWNGSIDLDPSPIPSDVALSGGFINVTSIPSIAPGGDVIVEIPWNAPNPADYNGINPQPWHFCLLARIIAANDPMSFPETVNLNANVRNNNNIAWKNLTVVDNFPGIIADPNDPIKSIVEVVAVGNIFNIPEVFDIIFSVPEKELNNPITNEATILISLDKKLYDKWVIGGKRGTGIEEMHTPNMSEQGIIHNNVSNNANFVVSDKKEFKITGNTAVFENIIFDVNESNTIDIKLLYPSNPVTSKKEFVYDIIQKKSSNGEIIGGVRYQIIKPECENFSAGIDKFINRGCTINLIATPINDDVIYSWFEANKLIGTSPIISVSPSQTTTYTLKALANNGCITEDNVVVSVSNQQCNRDKEIVKISPNPAKDIVAIEFKVKNTTTASLKLIKSDLSFKETIQ